MDIGENHRRTTEDAFLQRDVVVDRDVVLHLAAVADGDTVANKDVLAQRNARADPRAAANMGEMPDAAARADNRSVINDGAGVLIMAHPCAPTNGWVKGPTGTIGALRIVATVSMATRFSSTPKPPPDRISS